ncbi:helix-hairpin-helix domain-containing protein [Pedobacter cryoconitis]|uniref:Helix-hairpin-helix protein n=1 Tax=Pedobacter cryoconitis TaxID=188932 RepID=A0A327T6G5_9SPHI|nr:helix-hairpin-helix domain-containing protein [Pedobacter cryoconitis]RAJ35674.1 hypothetical protein LY11_00920 [Pedobacter cryoconitis]
MPKSAISSIQCPGLQSIRTSLPGCGILLYIVLFCPYNTVFAQQEVQIKEITATLSPNFTAEDLAELTEQLSFYLKHPLDLNSASPEQLKELFFLSALQISNFFTHIRLTGKLKDVLELQAVTGFDVTTITRLLPFVTVKEELPLDFSKAGKGVSELTLRYGQLLEKQKGYTQLPGSRYLGSPGKILLQYRYHLNDRAALSMVAKKDAGESFFSGNSKSGFDFISGSLALYKSGRFKKIIAGDYSLQFGQGLSLWSGSSFGKGDDVAGIAKKDTGLKPYTSANEYSFFRGTGVTYKVIESIDLTTFISLRNLDASLTKSPEGDYQLSAISTSGLHRTAAENEHKGKLGLLLYGAAVTYNKHSLDLGFTAYHSSYQQEFITGNQRYKKYNFSGRELTNLGFHYNYTFRNIYFFGEVAHSIPGGTAVLTGAMASLSPRVSAVVLVRNYEKEHVSFYNKAAGEGSTAANEKGVYAGFHINVTKKWTLSAYGDLFWFPWAKYRIDEASAGYELNARISFKPDKMFKALLSYQTKQSQQNEGSGKPVNPIADLRKDNCRLEGNFTFNRKITLQSRFELTRYQKGTVSAEYGYMFYQDVAYHPMSSRVSANLRLAFFHTPSYNSRIYAYEDDVLHGTGSGVYSGEGIRSYFNLSYNLSRQLRVWGRYAVYVYPGMEKTGSGLEEIAGSRKSEIKLQLRYQF